MRAFTTPALCMGPGIPGANIPARVVFMACGCKQNAARAHTTGQAGRLRVRARAVVLARVYRALREV